MKKRKNKDNQMLRIDYSYVILALMLAIFILFQITLLVPYLGQDHINNSINNVNHIDVTEANKENSRELIADRDTEFIIITGKDTNSEQSNVVSLALDYAKRGYKLCEEFSNIKKLDINLENIEAIIITTNSIEAIGGIEKLEDYILEGINIIFAVIPDIYEIVDTDLENILGIRYLSGYYTQNGVRVLPQFMIGNMMDYNDITFDTVYIKVNGTCKTYISGLVEGYDNPNIEDKVSNEEFPDILWRNIYKGSQIFVVNAPFFETNTESDIQGQLGIGILSAILGQLEPDYIYPIINGVSWVINNFPYYTNENKEAMQKYYSRDAQGFLEDIAFPNILSTAQTLSIKPTCYMTGGFLENNLFALHITPTYIRYQKQEISRVGGEIGISSLQYFTNSSTQNKELYKDIYKGYEFKSINLTDDYVDDFYEQLEADNIISLDKVNSILCNWKDSGLDYDKNGIVYMPITTRGFNHEDINIMTQLSSVTALGLMIHQTDLNDIVYPESDDDNWVNAYVDFTKYSNTYWKKFKRLDSLTISDISQRVLKFLILEPKIEKNDDEINIHAENFIDKAYFILRTSKDIVSVDNASYSIIENRIYLIELNAEDATIKLKTSDLETMQ